MHIVLWDTRANDVTKDFAGGFGVGAFPRRPGLGAWLIRRAFTRDRRPVALVYAYLAAIFQRMGHTVEYAEDRLPQGADVYLFHPALITLPIERSAMRRALDANPGAKVLVAGPVAHALPEAFAGLDVTLLDGEPEGLESDWNAALAAPSGKFALGRVDRLDDLPWPDWSLFAPQKFRIGYDFSRFPTALVQASRGCSFSCDYCPYVLREKSLRQRSPERVVAEIAAGVARHGFRSFKFRDPLFGVDRSRTLELASRLGKLPQQVQFSIESRIDLLSDDMLRALRTAGLTSVTVGIETPDDDTLRRHERRPIGADRQRDFVELCRSLGIRTVAGFMIGFVDDTREKIEGVLRYARALNPTFANFNIVTPYPGTHFFAQIKDDIADFDYSRYSVYEPVLAYRHLTAGELTEMHTRSFVSYYFRSRWLEANAHLVWPWLAKLGVGRSFGQVSRQREPIALGQREARANRGLIGDGPPRGNQPGRDAHHGGKHGDAGGRSHAA